MRRGNNKVGSAKEIDSEAHLNLINPSLFSRCIFLKGEFKKDEIINVQKGFQKINIKMIPK